MSAKTKIFFSTAVAKWDAEFYVKVDDDVHVNLGNESLFPFLSSTILKIWTNHCQTWVSQVVILVVVFFGIGMLVATLAHHHSKPRVYIGCMKSGPVLSQK